MSELSKDEKRALLEQELRLWNQNTYILETRYGVNKRIGADPGVLEAIKKDLERCALMIDGFESVLKELDKN